MWPSFSLCAWRILKIKSCLRRPLAPGKSSVRAILVSSVMFFSFSSAMVMVTYRDFQKGGLSWKRRTPRGHAAGLGSGSPPLCLRNVFRLAQDLGTFRLGNPVQNFIHGFLDTGIRLVELPGSLRRKLAEHITVTKSM